MHLPMLFIIMSLDILRINITVQYITAECLGAVKLCVSIKSVLYGDGSALKGSRGGRLTVPLEARTLVDYE